MFETICDINRINYADPIYYTKAFLDNPYVKANDLAKHIHFYNKELGGLRYFFFINLKGTIREITEVQKEQFFDGVVRSGPFETSSACYNFLDNCELVRHTKDGGGDKTDWIFFDSLRQPKKCQVERSINNTRFSQSDILFNHALEYEEINELSFHDNSLKHQALNSQRTTKYILRAGDIRKTHNRNDRDEQSKSIITYNEAFQILTAKAYSQKDKSVLLYEAEFFYNADNVLNNIVYTRHMPSRFYAGNFRQELNFEYDANGRLNRFNDGFQIKTWEYDEKGNPVYIEESGINNNIGFETGNSYSYDDQGNWIFKKTNKFRFQDYRKVLLSSAEINRQIEYF